MNFRAIQKILSDCAFHPNKPGPMKVIMDVGGTNYYLDRAVEMIRESQSPSIPSSEKWVLRQRAISLLAINILREQESEGGQSKRGKSHGKGQVHKSEATQAPQGPPVQSGGSGSGGDRPSGAEDPKIGVQPQGQEVIERGGKDTYRPFPTEEPARASPLDEINNHES